MYSAVWYYSQSLNSKLTSLYKEDAKSNSPIQLFKIFLLALKGLKLKDLFTELRFEISSFAWPCQEFDITKTSLYCPALGTREDLQTIQDI